MTKWIDQSALDATINRRRYSAFSPLHVAPRRVASIRVPRAGPRALPFHIFINRHYSAYALRRSPGARALARRFSKRKAEADDAHGYGQSLQRRIKLQPVRRLKRKRGKKGQRLRYHAKRYCHSRISPLIGPPNSGGFEQPSFFLFPVRPSSILTLAAPFALVRLHRLPFSLSFGSRSSFPFTISDGFLLADAFSLFSFILLLSRSVSLELSSSSARINVPPMNPLINLANRYYRRSAPKEAKSSDKSKWPRPVIG